MPAAVGPFIVVLILTSLIYQWHYRWRTNKWLATYGVTNNSEGKGGRTAERVTATRFGRLRRRMTRGIDDQQAEDMSRNA